MRSAGSRVSPGTSFAATTLQSITHPDDLDRDADSMRDLLDGKIPSCQIEKRYRHAWGHYLWVLLTVVARPE